MKTDFTIRPLTDHDREWVKQFIAWQWGVEIVVLHGAIYRAETLPGFVAICADEIVGLVTYPWLMPRAKSSRGATRSKWKCC
jgi:hypothetical protein